MPLLCSLPNLGGVLFSLEEGASFWNQSLTWRTLFCSMTALFILHFFMADLLTDKGDDTGWGHLAGGGLFSFGNFEYYSRRASASETCRVKVPLITDARNNSYSPVDWDEVGLGGQDAWAKWCNGARRRTAAHVLFKPPHHHCASPFHIPTSAAILRGTSGSLLTSSSSF